ncbi:MAG: hypothetical protein PVH88_22755 [Ignavibacteria bacterium]|jgi:hypothetical protein
MNKQDKSYNLNNPFYDQFKNYLICKYKDDDCPLNELELKNALLLGAHFRGISTVEGRRSAIVMKRKCYPDNLEEKVYDIFDKIFLKLYFQNRYVIYV